MQEKKKNTTKTHSQADVLTGLEPFLECPEFLSMLILGGLQAGSPLSRAAWPLPHDRRCRGFWSCLPPRPLQTHAVRCSASL